MKIVQQAPRVLLVAALLSLTSCINGFSTRYERIEDNKVRPLAMVVDTCDIAPGDTVTVSTYYAGADFDSLTWRASFNIAYNAIGVSAALDTLSLDDSSWYVPDSPGFVRDAASGTVIASIRIIIPSDIVRRSAELLGTTLASLGSLERSRLPPELLNLDTKIVIDFLEATSTIYNTLDSSASAALAARSDVSYADLPVDSATLSALIGGGASLDAHTMAIGIHQLMYVQHDTVVNGDTLRVNAFQSQSASLSRVFTAFFAVYQKSSSGTYAETYLPVRYTSRMRNNPEAQPNRNPVITTIGVYRQAPGKTFDIAKKSTWDKVWYLYNPSGPVSDTLQLSDSRTYYIGAVTDPQIRDLSFSASGEPVVENYYFDWFYHNDVTVSGLPLDSLLLIDPSGDSTAQFLPPRDHRMTQFSVWCSVWDGMIGERNRPQGTALIRVKGRIQYE